MEFKKLEIEQEGSRLRRFITSPQTKKSLIAIAIGAVAGFLLFYFTEGRNAEIITAGEVFKSLGIGGFLGFFITNSPCTRGKC
ncbi:MAG: hypothetical protein K9J25_13070 [Bacteroidales bacterium]|nr:hypothetical protein [Bacteroidales bacterium]